jgi:hypothetical protein
LRLRVRARHAPHRCSADCDPEFTFTMVLLLLDTKDCPALVTRLSYLPREAAHT